MNILKKRMLGLGAIFIIALMVLNATPATALQASSKVVFVGGYDTGSTGAGILPKGAPDFSPAFTFNTLLAGSVTAGNLANYDTVVLNMASSDLRCDKSRLSAAEQTALNNFVSAGGKMIISDPECRVGVNYSWLPYTFHTDNPGATGSSGGTLTIVEENELSTVAAGPKKIDTSAITAGTDAVGDMNVANTTNINPNWCLDMTGTNVRQKFGATHMYARYGSGLYIYNGFDTDDIATSVSGSGGGQLAKIWLQELQTSGSNLPCGVGVGGIALTPATATNPVNTSHTVTALVTIAGTGTPITGKTVTFLVTSGPNNGATGTGVTDAAGKASWTYPDNGGAGTDKIKASFVDNTGATISSSEVEKIWNGGGSSVPEFPSLVVPVAGIMGIVLLLFRRREN